MGIKWRTKIDHIPKMIATSETISGRKVQVGALTGSNAWLAGIHEYGCNISAKRAEYLTVPIHPDAAGRKASSFPDLFAIKSKKGNLLLVKKEGKDITPYYWLTKSVKIPERSFLRTGHDENADRILKQTERALGQVLAGKMSIDDMLDLYGQQMATAIKNRMKETQADSDITVNNKGSSTPLVDTGGLLESITWKRL